MEENLGQSSEMSAPVTSTPSVDTPIQTERTLPQSQVNELIGKAKHEAVESYKRNQQPSSNQSQPENRPQSDYRQSMSESDLRKIAAEEAQRHYNETNAQHQARFEEEGAKQVVQDFFDKISTGNEKYEDFEKVTGNITLKRYPNVVHALARVVDNSADVLYELGKNRSKMAQLERDFNEFPEDTMYEFKRLSESIKANESASKIRIPNSPLSQQRPSNTGTEAGGPLSMSQLKSRYKG